MRTPTRSLLYCTVAALALAASGPAGAAKRDREKDKKEDPAKAQPAQNNDKNYLQQARDKYADMDLVALPGLLAEALLQPDLRREDYLEIYKLQGFSYTSLGDTQKAREAFLRLLAIDPNFEMGANESPRYRNVFAEIKKEFKGKAEIALTHTPPTAGKPGESIPLELTVKDVFGRINQGTAKVRAVLCGKEGAYVDVPLQGAGTKDGERTFKGKLPDPAASIPGDKPAGYFLDYQFTFSNQVGDPVEVKGGKPSYRLTVGSAAAAAEPCAAPAAANSGKSEEGGGGVSLLPVLLGSAGAGVVVFAVVAVAVIGVSGGAATGVALFCNFNRAQCNLPKSTSNGRVSVSVERGSTQ